MADPRLNHAEKMATARRFMAMPLCCLDQGLTRKLRQRVHDAEALFEARNVRLADALAWADPHNGEVECMRALNQRHHDSTTTWAAFVAHFINTRARTAMKKEEDARTRHHALCQPPPALAAPAPPLEDAAAQT
eukprot:1349588-Alexandrium_andersonii.AAC.1